MAEQKQLVLFDGVCNFCNGAVLFVVDRDPHEHFVFAPLQSEVGERTLRQLGMENLPISTMVLVDGGRAWLRSNAILRVTKGLRWPWPLAFYLLAWIPTGIRDVAYRYFAGHRYSWFGKSKQCRIPTPELRRRFIA